MRVPYICLGIFCLSVALMESVLGVRPIYFFLDGISFEWLIKIEYLSFTVSHIALLIYIKTMYLSTQKSLMYRLTSGVNGFYCLLIIFTSVQVFGATEMQYISVMLLNYLTILIILRRVMLKKAKNIWFLHVGISAMLITILFDVFFVNNIGNYYFSAKNFYIGVLFFLFLQMHGVSVEVKKAFDSMDHAKDMEIAFLQAQIGSHFFSLTH